MHVHTDVPAASHVLGLYVANGVTGVRDMAGRWEALRAWRDSIAAGALVGPRLIASGPYLVGGDTPIPHILARDTAEGRRGVDSLAALGVPFVKVHTGLRPDVFFAILRRARERRLPVGGHVSATVGAQAASDSGIRSIEHLLGVPMPCTPAESVALAPRFPTQAALGRCSSRDLAPLYAAMARNATWVTPTLTAALEIARWPRRNLPGDSVAPFIPDTLRRFVAGIFPMPENVPAGADGTGLKVFERRLRQVADMHRAGVGILAGTDAPLRNSPPGFGIHQELRYLVLGGMSNFAVLRAATLEPARALGMTDSLGTIEPGKLADLVLLARNPLIDIGNTAAIVGIVANGRYIDARARQQLLRPDR
jgi:imidazolonepropionase-like amidohydrolase